MKTGLHVTALLILGSCWGQARDVAFSVGDPETVLPHERQHDLGIAFIDSGLPMVNARGQLTWFCLRVPMAYRCLGESEERW